MEKPSRHTRGDADSRLRTSGICPGNCLTSRIGDDRSGGSALTRVGDAEPISMVWHSKASSASISGIQCLKMSEMSTALQLPATTLTVGNLAAYRQAVFSLPMLSAEKERELAERYRDEQDLDAAWELVTAHLRFVVRIARGYNGYGLPQADLIQEGNIGLMKAVKRFDPNGGRAARLLRGPLDQGRNSRVHSAQLANRQGRHHQGATQAVLQPAKLEKAARLDVADGNRGHRRRPRSGAEGRGRDGAETERA